MKTHLPLLLALLALPLIARGQGSLTPSAAPAPTMKTLAQVEARIALGRVGGSTEAIAISQPGSYYLLGNLTVASGDAITIAASDVTLDLCGFTIATTANPRGGTAVLVASGLTNTTIRNGFIRSECSAEYNSYTGHWDMLPNVGFAEGVAGAGLAEELHVSGIGGTCINASVVRHCTACSCRQGIVAREATDSSASNSCQTAITAESVLRCRGSCEGGGYGIYATGRVVGSYGESRSDASGTTTAGIYAHTVGDSTGRSQGSTTGSCGIRTYGTDDHGATENCIGLGADGIITGAATNCRGIATSGIGLSAETAINSYGATETGTCGLSATGTASFCRAANPATNGIALSAAIAVACTAESGTIQSASKQLGTP